MIVKLAANYLMLPQVTASLNEQCEDQCMDMQRRDSSRLKGSRAGQPLIRLGCQGEEGLEVEEKKSDPYIVAKNAWTTAHHMMLEMGGREGASSERGNSWVLSSVRNVEGQERW
jgi:hypothetical protein